MNITGQLNGESVKIVSQQGSGDQIYTSYLTSAGQLKITRKAIGIDDIEQIATNSTDTTFSNVVGGNISASNIDIYTSGTTDKVFTDALLEMYGNSNSYVQATIQNQSSGTNASTDFVATSDTGTDSSNYIDLGINGSGFIKTSAWSVNGANDGYLYTQGGNLSIGTSTSGKSVDVFVGGTTSANKVLTVGSDYIKAPYTKLSFPAQKCLRWGAFGDSLTSYLITNVCQISDYKMRVVYASASAGQGSSTVLSNIRNYVNTPSLVAQNLDWFSIQIGTNDFNLASSAYIANVSESINLLRSIGANVLLFSLPPQNAQTSSTQTHTHDLEYISQTMNVPLIRPWRFVNDGNGAYISTYSSDGIHPKTSVLPTLAQEAYAQMTAQGIIPRYEAVRCDMNQDPLNLFKNGLLLTDTNADGLADNISKFGTWTATSAATTYGKKQVATYTGTSGNLGFLINGPTVVSGNSYVFKCKYSHTMTSASTTADFTVNYANGKSSSNIYTIMAVKGDNQTRTWEINHEYVATSSGTNNFNIYIVSTTDMAGTFSVENISLIDYTANPWV